MRKFILALSLSLAPGLFAQTADMEIIEYSINRLPTLTGERFGLTFRWRNNGPDDARNVRVELVGTPTPFVVLSTATSGWPCYPSPDGTSFLCQNALLPAGAEAQLRVQMLTPPVAGSLVLRGSVSSAWPDPNLSNNTAQITLPLQAQPAADLSLTPTSQLHVANAGEAVSMQLDVTNSSDRTLEGLIAYISVPVTDDQPEFEAGGPGWSCGKLVYGPQAVVCTRASIAAGANAPITVTTHAPQSEGSFTIYARVAGEAHTDPFTMNDAATLTVRVGEEEQPPPAPSTWNVRLLPVLGADIPGSGGALWRTEVTALFTGDEGEFVRPHRCELGLVPCETSPFPIGQPFNAYERGLVGFVPSVGQFVYVPAEHDDELHLNARVYDVSRQEETAGAEMPIPRGEDFTGALSSIVGIPVAPQYRHTLRIYDLDARAGGQVQIRIYANQETTPRTTFVRALEVPSSLRTLSGIDRPSHPGVIQLQLGQHLELAGLQSVRVDVEPLDAGLRLWSFVSVTNNETHHVTTFTRH